jgi:hypothetical protein
MKTSTDTIIKALRILAGHIEDGGSVAEQAARRLEQLTMPDDATLECITVAMEDAFAAGSEPPPYKLRVAYLLGVKAVDA